MSMVRSRRLTTDCLSRNSRCHSAHGSAAKIQIEVRLVKIDIRKKSAMARMPQDRDCGLQMPLLAASLRA